MRSWGWTGILWALFIASRVAIFLFMAGKGTDLGVHRKYAARVLAGWVPFRDFAPEYPPLVFVFTMIPAVIDPTLHWYFPLFRAMCCAVDLSLWIVLLTMIRGHLVRAVLYLLCTTALGSLLYDRIDIVLGAILIAAIWWLYAGRWNWFLGVIGTGIAFKLIPFVAVPALLAVQSRRSPGGVWRALALIATASVLSLGLTAALGGWRFAELLRYHGERGIQIESAPASVEMVLMQSGVAGEIGYEYQSINLHTPYEPALIRTGLVLLMVLMVCGAWLGWRLVDDYRGIALLIAGLLCGALVFSKVLSPQYFVFLLPVLLVAPWPEDRGSAIANGLLILFIYVLSGIIFPSAYEQVVRLSAIGEGLVIIRNEALLILAASLLYRASMRKGIGTGSRRPRVNGF